jgi:hypothetical protein
MHFKAHVASICRFVIARNLLLGERMPIKLSRRISSPRRVQSSCSLYASSAVGGTKLGFGFSVVVHPIIPSKQTVNAIVSAGLILAFFPTSFCHGLSPRHHRSASRKPDAIMAESRQELRVNRMGGVLLETPPAPLWKDEG